jgi:FkbM family methyltransferase
MRLIEKARLVLLGLSGEANARSLLRWRLERADHRLYEHLLKSGDTVFDVGGYLGSWTSGMLTKYPCKYHVFEPHPEAFSKLTERFSGHPEVHLHEFALGAANGVVLLSSAAEGSSIVSNRGSDPVEVKLMDVRQHLRNQQNPVALMKLNIEGAEYNLLEQLLWSEESMLTGDFLVQFHSGFPHAEQRYERIARKLGETHHCVWRYAFLWELWRKTAR